MAEETTLRKLVSSVAVIHDRRSCPREPASANGVDFVHEDDTGLMVARGLTDVLVDNGRGDHLEEVGLKCRSARSVLPILGRP
jgi:hypothetical protein